VAGLRRAERRSVFPVILGLITVGLGQGALVTLLFNVLVTSSPKELAIVPTSWLPDYKPGEVPSDDRRTR